MRGFVPEQVTTDHWSLSKRNGGTAEECRKRSGSIRSGGDLWDTQGRWRSAIQDQVERIREMLMGASMRFELSRTFEEIRERRGEEVEVKFT